jgi:repressor LexA
MSKSLSKRQEQILSCITQHVASHGYPPTVREIGLAVNLSSSSTVHAHLKTLEEHGHIQREAVLTRAIKVMPAQAPHAPSPARPIVQVPILGTVAAGSPRLAVQEVEEMFPLPHDFISGDGFMLRVKGDSMIDDGIHENDFVVVRAQKTAENGETVVAMIDNEATVKRFFKEKKQFRLQPANKRMKAMYFDDVEIVGKVVGLVRRLA